MHSPLFLRLPLSQFAAPMTHDTDNPAASDVDFNEVFLLVSRQIDDDLSQEDLSRLTTFEEKWPLRIARFRSQCLEIRGILQSLPVCSLAGSLATPLPLVRPQTARPRMGTRHLIGGILTSVLCAGILLLVVKPWQNNAAPELAQVDFAPRNVSSMESEALPEVADMVANSVIADSPAEFAPEAAPAVQPVIQSDNWNVVVVKVDGDDRDLAMDRIQSIVHQHGLRVQMSAGQDRPEWLGVVLTSAGTGREEVLNAMERGLGENSQANHPETHLAHSAPAEIIAAVRESLRYPTQSEFHHGKIFVALPPEGPTSSGQSPGLPSVPPASTAIPSGKDASESPRDDSTKRREFSPAPKESSIAVTLVVFEFGGQKAKSDGRDGASGKSSEAPDQI